MSAAIVRSTLKFKKIAQGESAQLPNGGTIFHWHQKHFAVDISQRKYERVDQHGVHVASGPTLASVLPELADDSTVEALRRSGKKWSAARANEREAAEAAYAAIAAAAAAGIAETRIAKELGVDRMTVRRALGKR